MEEIARSGLRDALEGQLAGLLSDALDKEHGSSRDAPRGDWCPRWKPPYRIS